MRVDPTTGKRSFKPFSEDDFKGLFLDDPEGEAAARTLYQEMMQEVQKETEAMLSGPGPLEGLPFQFNY